MSSRGILGGANAKTNKGSTCTVKVDSTDTVCSVLDDKILVGPSMTKTIVPGPAGLSLLLDSIGAGGSSFGYDSMLPDPLVIETFHKFPIGDDNKWIMHYGGTSIATRQGMYELSFNETSPEDGYTVHYLSTQSKVLDANRDTTKPCHLVFATNLPPNGQTVLEGNYFVTIGYMNNLGAFEILDIPGGGRVHETIGMNVEMQIRTFDVPANIAAHSPLIINIVPYKSAFTPESGIAKTWNCTPVTLYVPVLNYPLEITQFLTV